MLRKSFQRIPQDCGKTEREVSFKYSVKGSMLCSVWRRPHVSLGLFNQPCDQWRQHNESWGRLYRRRRLSGELTDQKFETGNEHTDLTSNNQTRDRNPIFLFRKWETSVWFWSSGQRAADEFFGKDVMLGAELWFLYGADRIASTLTSIEKSQISSVSVRRARRRRQLLLCTDNWVNFELLVRCITTSSTGVEAFELLASMG